MISNPSDTLIDVADDNIDFVLVWDGSNNDAISKKAFEIRKIFEQNLEDEGLILKRKSINSKNLNFLLIQAPLEVLKRYGEILKFRMPIKLVEGIITEQSKNEESYSTLTGKSCIKRILNYLFGLNRVIFPKKKHAITTVYNRDKEYFLFDEDVIKDFFTPGIRARIVQYILKRKRYKEGDESLQSDLAFGYDRLLLIDAYSAAYPLHDGDYTSLSCQRGLLFKEWGNFKNVFKYQPLDAIKDYFGPKIGMYFTWLGYYAYMLIPVSLLGIACLIYGLLTLDSDTYVNDVCNSTIMMCPLCITCPYWELKTICFHSKIAYLFDNESTALFAFLMSIWTIIFLEFWKRYSNEINHEWHLVGYDEKDLIPRPEFLSRFKNVKKRKLNFVTNTVEPAIPFWKMKLPYTLCSISTMLILIVIALAAVLGVIMFRLSVLLVISQTEFQHEWLVKHSLISVSLSAAVINLIFICLFNRLYDKIAKYITEEIEFPRTQHDYETSYAFKIYILQFINHYASIFYIAYFKGNFVGSPIKYEKYFNKWRKEECGISCMPELCIQLAVIMIGMQTKNAIVEMFYPFIQNLFRKLKLHARITQDKADLFENQIAKDYELLDWDNDLTQEYLEMVIQYGFVTIFVSAFPLAPLFALINNYIEVRLDAQKLIKYYKRPIWQRVNGIGIWYDVMDSLAKFAVLSNAFILAITSNLIPKLMYRFARYKWEDPRYGTLNGFLEHSLTTYNTSDIEQRPKSQENVLICSYPQERYGHDEVESKRYQFTDFYWKLWLARVIFIITFENLVTVSVLFLRWLIPPIPQKLQDITQREEFLTNEIVIKEELMKSRGIAVEQPVQTFKRGRGLPHEDESLSRNDSMISNATTITQDEDKKLEQRKGS